MGVLQMRHSPYDRDGAQKVEFDVSIEGLRTLLYASFYFAVTAGIVISILYADIDYKDNMILRVFGVNNICIFFDVAPTTYFMPIFWVFTCLAFTLERAVSFVRIWLASSQGRLSSAAYYVLKWLMVYQVVSSAYFSVCFAVQPNDLHSLRIHTLPYMNLMVAFSTMSLTNMYYALHEGYDGFNFQTWQKAVMLAYSTLTCFSSVNGIACCAYSLTYGAPWWDAPFPPTDKLWLFLALVVPPAWNFYLANEWRDQSELVSFSITLGNRPPPTYIPAEEQSASAEASFTSISSNSSKTPPSWLSRFPYLLFFLAMIILLRSPLNNSKPYRYIATQEAWRAGVAIGGILMGFGYALAGFIIVMCRPFAGLTAAGPYLQQFAYTMLIPLGLAMGLLHTQMYHYRMGTETHKPITIGNSQTILACTIGQAVWLIVWGNWLKQAVVYSKEAQDDDLAETGTVVGSHRVARLASIGLTCCSSTIIVVSFVLRVSIFLAGGGSPQKFDEAYCGGGGQLWSNSTQLWHATNSSL